MQASKEVRSAVSVRIGIAAAVGFATLVAPSLTGQASAHRRDFPFTYDWKQPAKGEKEIELKTTYRGSDNQVKQEIEFEYGITKRFMLAPYVFFEKNPGDQNLRYTGVKLEGRYQLGDYKTNTILPGLYLEFENEKGGEREIEGKLILSRYSKKDENFSFNYIVERKLENGAEFENEYSLGYARPFGKSGARIGGEWIHNLSDGQINAGPTFAFEPLKDIWLVAGAALPVNKRNGNRTELRVLAEYEF